MVISSSRLLSFKRIKWNDKLTSATRRGFLGGKRRPFQATIILQLIVPIAPVGIEPTLCAHPGLAKSIQRIVTSGAKASGPVFRRLQFAKR